MASREFLKILKSARIGDVSAQQKLAEAYLNGTFNTPIQPSNALIWLEKSYLSLLNQSVGDASSGIAQNNGLMNSLVAVPLCDTFTSPAFGFGWKSFWHLAQSETSVSAAAQWQLADLVLNPLKHDLQNELARWVEMHDSEMEFSKCHDLAKHYLSELAQSDTPFTSQAKELLIKLQPKNEALASLWNAWLTDKNKDALHQAAELGLTIAKLTLGLQLAQFDEGALSKKEGASKSNAALKKAAHWLELAAKDGDRDAWFALGEIYRRPQFSGYNAAESDRCFGNAADLGHPQAQLRRGANLWRKREKINEKVRGLQASYWVWQAHQQGVVEAEELLSKILESASTPKKNDWYALASLAEEALNHHAEHKLDEEWLLMCHRLIIANQFNLSKAELLLCEVGQLQHEHCVVVDIRWELPKILPRLIQIDTIKQRRSLLAAGKAFASAQLEQEGNLRQRRYRFDRVSAWLNHTFSGSASSSDGLGT